MQSGDTLPSHAACLTDSTVRFLPPMPDVFAAKRRIMIIDDSSILFLKRYLFARLRDLRYAYLERTRHSIHYDTTWEAVREVSLVVFRLGIITPSTYKRIIYLLHNWDAYKKP